VDAHVTTTNTDNGNGSGNAYGFGNGNGNAYGYGNGNGDGNGNGNSSTAVSLNDLAVGNTVRLMVATDDTTNSNNGNGNGNAYGQNKKSDSYINAAFVEFSRSQATGALEQALGLTTWQAGLIPAVSVGDQLLLADVDNAAVKMSQASYASALIGHTE